MRVHPDVEEHGPTWLQDARGDALEHPAHGLPGAEGAGGTADYLLHQQLHGLQGGTHTHTHTRS